MEAVMLLAHNALSFASAFLGGIVLPGGVMKLLTSLQDNAVDNR
jgi:hypothetical protein